MKKVIILALISVTITSCLSDSIKKDMNKSLRQSFHLMDDKDFKNGLSLIEMHKLRNGSYPDELSDIEFVSIMDVNFMHRLEYIKLDTLYELNLISILSKPGKGKSNQKTTNINAKNKYPPEFWNGLGCAKSNMK